MCTLLILLRRLISSHASREAEPIDPQKYTILAIIAPGLTLLLAMIWTPVLPATIVGAKEDDVQIQALACL